MASNKKTDIEYEMSKFEAELSKISSLTPATPPTSVKPKISIQITSLPTTIQPSKTTQSISSSNVYIHHQQQQQHQTYASIMQPPPPPPISTYIPSNPAPVKETSVPSISKRDSSGNLKSAPTTAAAAATAVAAADMENKAKKAKIEKDKKKKKIVRAAGGQVWEDDSLADWDTDDFRLFCGDLGNEVTDDALARAFQKYPSFQKAKVIRDKRTGKTKGYGFISFKNSDDFIKAMREMNGKYVGNRPIKLRKSNWKDRNLDIVKKKEVEKQKMGFK